jgi:cold shock CspA family protein
MATGSVTVFNGDKSHEFIQPGSGGKDVSVRISAI